jgi:hypothetical protein
MGMTVVYFHECHLAFLVTVTSRGHHHGFVVFVASSSCLKTLVPPGVLVSVEDEDAEDYFQMGIQGDLPGYLHREMEIQMLTGTS